MEAGAEPDAAPDLVGFLLVAGTGIRNELRNEGQHDHTAVPGKPGEHVVGHIARMLGYRPAGRVRENDRRTSAVEGVVHRSLGHVRQVDDDAETVQLRDHGTAEIGEAEVDRRTGGRRGPRRVVVMSEREVPHTRATEHPQHAQRPRDAVATLRAHERRDPTVSDRRPNVRRRVDFPERLREQARDPLDGVHLFESGDHGFGWRHRRRHENRPKLRGHSACPQTRQVSMKGRLAHIEPGRLNVGPERLAKRPGQVVVAVEDRRHGEVAVEDRRRCGIG